VQDSQLVRMSPSITINNHQSTVNNESIIVNQRSEIDLYGLDDDAFAASASRLRPKLSAFGSA
jgi:hypothetical protein